MSDAYVDSMLAPGEAIQMEARQHWVALIRFALQPILVLIAAFVFLGIGMWLSPTGDGLFNDLLRLIDSVLGWITVGLFILAIAWLPIQIFRWTKRRYMVTDRRVLYLEGGIRHTSTDAGLHMITDVSFRQTFLGQRLGFGDLVIATAANRPLEFRQMRDAVEFKQAIMAAQQGTVVARADEILQADGMAPIAAAAPVVAATAAPAAVAAAVVEAPAEPAWDGSDVPQMAEDDLPPADPLIFGTPAVAEAVPEVEAVAEPVAEVEVVAEAAADAVEAVAEPVAEAEVEAVPEVVAEAVADAAEAAEAAVATQGFAPVGAESVTQALASVAALRDSGAITEAESEAKKQELLDLI